MGWVLLPPVDCFPWGGPALGSTELYGRVDSDLQEDPRTAASRASVPMASHCWPTPPQETLQHQQGGLVQYPVMPLILSPGSLYTQDFVCVLQEWSLCFPQAYGSPVIKSHWPSDSDSLGIPRPLARCPGWEAWWGFRTFTRVGELLWYYCSGMRFDFIVFAPLLPSRCSFFFVFGLGSILFWWIPGSSCWWLFNS